MMKSLCVFVFCATLCQSSMCSAATVLIQTSSGGTFYDISWASLFAGVLEIYVKGNPGAVCYIEPNLVVPGEQLEMLKDLNSGSKYDYVIECSARAGVQTATRIRPRLTP